MSPASPTDGEKTSKDGRLNTGGSEKSLQRRPHIVVVDDYSEIHRSLLGYLEDHGFHVSTVTDGLALRRVLAKSRVDLIVFDVVLTAGGSGLDLCRQIRRRSIVPILLLSAHAEESDRIIGFETGADAYMSKPFSRRELLGRVNALLRRVRGNVLESAVQLCAARFGDWTVVSSPARLLRHRDGSVVKLSPKESLLLALLLNARGRVLLRSQLINAMGWNDLNDEARRLDIFVGRLRRKLRDEGRSQRLIRTVYAEGYALTCDGSSSPPVE